MYKPLLKRQWSVNWLLLLLLLSPLLSNAQAAKEYCVQVTATVQESPAQITLHWPFDTAGVTNYTISKKAKTAAYWGTILATLPPTTTAYIDTAVTTDTAYEYRVHKTATGIYTSEGYIFAGIKYPAIEYRGKLLMLVDSALNDSLSVELNRLMKDISGDGWAVQRMDVSVADSDIAIKDLIRNEYLADSTNLKAVLLVGHITVPYSGSINPDGHANHLGAWPADVYYATMNFKFTDNTTYDTVAGLRTATHNVPGDGKWDQSYLYGSKIELQISRIDLSNMPAFNRTQNQLMKTYLDKDHAYRMKTITTIARGLIDDNFGAFSGEAFSINGWRNFAPLLGDTNIVAADYITTLDTAKYQWSYGCGGGSYNSAGGIGSTTNFVNSKVQTIFSMMFGSYFGDWDNTNNFLRAPLCAPEPALTNCWAGRPHWMFHHMALGENIGYCANLTQNQTGGLYTMNYGAGSIHVALMGDLTLRQHVIAPPTITALSDTNENVKLLWAASTDNVSGYYVYRCNTEFGKFVRVSPAMVTGSSFTDVGAGPGLKYYMVKAVRLENTPSGTYYNLSEGITDTITVRDTINVGTVVVNPTLTPTNLTLYPNPTSDVLNVAVTGTGVENILLEVIDIHGRLLSTIQYNGGMPYVALPVAGLPTGVYFCRMVVAEGMIQKRFEVVR